MISTMRPPDIDYANEYVRNVTVLCLFRCHVCIGYPSVTPFLNAVIAVKVAADSPHRCPHLPADCHHDGLCRPSSLAQPCWLYCSWTHGRTAESADNDCPCARCPDQSGCTFMELNLSTRFEGLWGSVFAGIAERVSLLFMDTGVQNLGQKLRTSPDVDHEINYGYLPLSQVVEDDSSVEEIQNLSPEKPGDDQPTYNGRWSLPFSLRCLNMALIVLRFPGYSGFASLRPV